MEDSNYKSEIEYVLKYYQSKYRMSNGYVYIKSGFTTDLNILIDCWYYHLQTNYSNLLKVLLFLNTE